MIRWSVPQRLAFSSDNSLKPGNLIASWKYFSRFQKKNNSLANHKKIAKEKLKNEI